MSYDHSLTLNTYLQPGLAKEHLTKLFMPLIEYFGMSNHPDLWKTEEFQHRKDVFFAYDANTGETDVYTCGDVSYLFDTALNSVVASLGEVAPEPDYFILTNHDHPDPDEARTEIWFGRDAAAIVKAQKELRLNEALFMLKECVSETKYREVTRVLSSLEFAA